MSETTRRRLAPPTPEAVAIRERALDVCRTLFNEHGFPGVTTAQIAVALGMNEGHLHYYFNTKQQIVTALFDEFEEQVIEAAASGLDAPSRPDKYDGYLRNWFAVMWRYRFFYRDQLSLHRVAPALRRRLSHVYVTGQDQLRRVLADMADMGLIEATTDERDLLVVNAWILSCCWIDYVVTLHGRDDVTAADLDRGMRQINSLFKPYRVRQPRSALVASA